jgi:hypothetical protein
MIVPFDYSGKFNTVVFTVNRTKNVSRYSDSDSSSEEYYENSIYILDDNTDDTIYCSHTYCDPRCKLLDMNENVREDIYISCTNNKYYDLWEDYDESCDYEGNTEITVIKFKVRFCLI